MNSLHFDLSLDKSLMTILPQSCILSFFVIDFFLLNSYLFQQAIGDTYALDEPHC
jgi:hypothetical protein